MRRTCLCLSLAFALVLALAGCPDDATPPAEISLCEVALHRGSDGVSIDAPVTVASERAPSPGDRLLLVAVDGEDNVLAARSFAFSYEMINSEVGPDGLVVSEEVTVEGDEALVTIEGCSDVRALYVYDLAGDEPIAQLEVAL